MSDLLQHWPDDLSEGDERRLQVFRDEIHARVFWGESPEELRGWALQQDIEATPALIDEMIQHSTHRRGNAIRKLGIRDLAIGAMLLLPGFTAAVIGGARIYSGSGMRWSLAALAVGAIATLVGGWFINRGFDRAMFGGANRGKVEDSIY